jgi:nucleoside-diphosphate-sugar epimerase
LAFYLEGDLKKVPFFIVLFFVVIYIINMLMKNQKALVTGAGGFVGSHLVEALVKDGAKVRAFVHYNSRNDWGMLEYIDKKVLKEVEVIAGDIRDADTVRKIVK